jgi:uridine kinase
MHPTFIGIAGGSGAGKSTLCFGLMEKHPSDIGMIQLDDYFKPADQVPAMLGYTNYDHPDALDFARLDADLSQLAGGHAVTIRTRNEKLNPDYKKTKQKIAFDFVPKKIMLIEGFLALFDERIRSYMATTIWLEADHSIRWNRRVHFKNPGYDQDVLLPMHEQFVVPTRVHAQHHLCVTSLSASEVLKSVEEMIFNI